MKQLLTLDEVVAILGVVGAAPALVQRFTTQATDVLGRKNRRTTTNDGTDHVTVGSGYGTVSRRGFVELVINETLTQMDPAKAREIGLMLIEAAEAGISDQIVMTLLREKVNLSPEALGAILIDLREVRQGTRGVVHPS